MKFEKIIPYMRENKEIQTWSFIHKKWIDLNYIEPYFKALLIGDYRVKRIRKKKIKNVENFIIVDEPINEE